VLDELRHRLYLINNNINNVNIFDYDQGKIIGSIPVGNRPISGAISLDGKSLYVASGVTTAQVASGAPILNVIDLSQNRVTYTATLKAAPQGVEVGADGRVLISTLGTGVVAGAAQNVLAVYDPANQQLLDVTVPALPTTPTPLPAANLGRPTLTFTGRLLRTPDGNFIIGVITPNATSTYIFVYEVASGIVLRNRTVNGVSSVLSVSPDGSRFMAGSTMFDTATLAVIGLQNNANAPFATTAIVSNAQNIGGSVFTPDGTVLYSAFNTAANTNPPPPAQSSTLLVNDPTNLGIRMGIKLPESLVGRILMTSDGANAWGLSDSGLINLPFGKLYDYPILMPETTQVFLSMDDCNRGVAKGTLRINNIGKGRLTYTVGANSAGAALVYQQSSGLAPSSLTFSMEPGRSGVVRQAGTNLWTGTVGTSNGTPVTISLSSPDAINIPPAIRVYMNYRLSDQRGVVYPVPTTSNNNAGNNGGNPAGNEGLQDILLDEARGKVYITNSGYNRIEVFDTKKQHFLDPIVVGQMPHQMAMGGDGKTLYVANTGGESIQMIDLELGRALDSVVFPPVPRNGTATLIYPRSLAMGYRGLQFLMSDGSQWKVVGNEALPRPTDNITPVRLANCPACAMVATPGGDSIITLSGNGNAYVYDSTLDTYVTTKLLIPSATTTPGYYGVLGAGPGGAYYLVNGLIVSQSLTTLGGSATPGGQQTTGIGIPGLPGGGLQTTVINTGNRNVATVAPLNDKQFLRLTTPVRQNITTATRDDSRTTLDMVNLATGEVTLAGVVPENPVVSVVGTTHFNTNPRQMVVDSAGTTAYAITLSGLSVIALTPSTSDTRPAIASTRGIVNSTDGSATLRPGSFITLNGSNLAASATADTIPPPTVLGGSCVTFGDIAVPLLVSASGQIQAQIPDTLPAGTHVVEVRSLATAQQSDPVIVTVRP
jgi:DNA-binding beta-propeller fold protein YncE